MKKHVSILMIALLVLFASCSDDNDKAVYSVTFETDGGSPVPSAQRVEEGSTATAPSSNPAKVGYAFLFWYLDGATTAYNFQTPVNGNLTLFAKWQEETTAEYWQVSWNLNGGTWPSGDNHAIQVIKGGTLAEPNAPTKSGSTFDGWYKESGLTNKINFPYDVSSVTGNFTLYAKWATEGGGDTDPSGYKMFTSISDLKSWLTSQADNTEETAYKVGLKGVNLDTGNNWGDLGLAIKGTKYVDLDLGGCTGTVIPDGKTTATAPPNIVITYYGVFVNCSRLVAIHLPDGLKTIGQYTFWNCNSLRSVTVPESLADINANAFYYCGSLETIVLPEGLKSIGGDAFCNSGLTSITIPGSVSNLGAGVFMKCYELTEIVMLSAIPPSLGNDAFWRTPDELKIKVPATSVATYKAADEWKDWANRIVANAD